MTEENDHLKVLEAFKKRKGMYISTENLDSVQSFLSGYICAVLKEAPNGIYPHDVIHEVGANRGGKKSACGPIYSI